MDTKEVKETKKEKCFVIMPISDQGDYPSGHFKKVYEQIFKPAIEEAGYDAYRVDEDDLSTPIIGKIFKALQECPMALCDLSNRNPNVLYELGIRQAYDKPVVLVKDNKTETIFDVAGINTLPYESARLYEDVIDARARIKEAIISNKEGQQSSMIKVIKAQRAIIETAEMTKDDRIEFMLSELMRDIGELKKDSRMKRRTNSEKMIVDYRANCEKWNQVLNEKYLEKNALEEVYYKIKRKQGITKAQVEREMIKIQSMLEVEIDYRQIGVELEIVIKGKSISQIAEAIELIEKRLGA